MDPLRLLPVILLLIGQAVILFWAMRHFSANLVRQNSRKFGLGLCFLQQLLVLALPLAGFYAEAELQSIKERIWEWVSPRTSPFEPFLVEGDPGLVRHVEQQKPMLKRPSFEDGSAFVNWQQSLRQDLSENVFDWRKNAQKTLGPANVSMKVINRTSLENNLRRSFITFPGFDRTPIPAYLFEPADRKKHPAIVVLPGHGKGIVETAGLVNSYQHSVALRLAEAGFVVLTPEFRGFGYLGSRIGNEHRLTAYNALLSGSFYKAVLLQDVICAVDLLVCLPHVDGERIGMTGVSLGGEMSVTYAALDRRIRAVCVQGYGGDIGKCSARQGEAATRRFLQGKGPHYCHLIPGSNQHLLREDLFLLIHPRPLLAIRGRQEQARSELWEMLEEAYSSLGNAGLFGYQSRPGGHEYFVEPALEFFHQRLHQAP